MAENKKSVSEALEGIENMVWSFNDHFCKCFLYPEESNRQRENVSILRRNNAIHTHEREIINQIIKTGENRYREFIEKITNQPRVHAQKFIGKKNIRKFIFKRDKVCLRCGKNDNLSIDHIVSVNKEGCNKISNLQTLCCSCNSWKSDKIIDFRPGARVPNNLMKQ